MIRYHGLITVIQTKVKHLSHFFYELIRTEANGNLL